MQSLNGVNSKDGPKLVVEGDQVHYEVEPQEGSSRKKATPGEVHTHILKYMHGKLKLKLYQPEF